MINKEINKHSRNTRKKTIILLVSAAILALTVVFALIYWYRIRVNKGVESTKESTIWFDGKEYKRDRKVKGYVFIGVDDFSETRDVDSKTKSVGDTGRADTVIIMAHDSKKRTAQLVHVSRNTMCDIEVFDDDGKFKNHARAQLALQYSYGQGGKRSCRLMKSAVSKLLYNTKMNSYFALSLSGIKACTDAIGGIVITIPEDYTYIDPAFQKDATITMNGIQAEKYVRYRDLSVEGSNQQRIERQAQMLDAVINQLEEKLKTMSVKSMLNIYSKVSKYINSSLSFRKMKKISTSKFNREQITLPGTTTVGEDGFEEYNLDEHETKRIIVSLFYKPVKK